MNSRRGIALIIVLIVSSVLAVLAVAFVAINRQQLTLTGDTLRRSQAMDAALTGLAYARYRLEANGTWGAKAFTAGTQGPTPFGSAVNVTIHGDGLDTGGPDGHPDISKNWVAGTARGSGVEAEFTIRLVNNLQKKTVVTNPDPNQLQLGEVPAEAIRVRVEGRCGRVTRRLEATLRKKAFVDSNISTDLDLTVNPGMTPKRGWTLSTRDSINTARANGNITVPKPSDSLLRFAGVRGSLKSAQDVIVGGLSMADSANSAVRAAEQRKANGTFSPQQAPVVIPQLKANQLAFPERSINNVSAGTYEFLTATYNVVDVGGFTISKYCRALKLPNGQIMASQLAEVVIPTGDPPEGAGGGPGWQSIGGVTPQEAEFGMVVLGSTDDSEPTKSVAVDLKSGSLGFPPGATVHVDGNLDFLGASAASPPPGYRSTNVPANFTALFGADASVGGGIVKYTMPGTSFEELQEEGGAVNVSGRLTIGGEASGLGGISAEGNVAFSANPALSSTKNLGIAVRAGSGLKVEPPPKLSRSGILAADAPAFIGAHDQLSSSQQSQMDQGIDESLVDALSTRSTGVKAEAAAAALETELSGLGFYVSPADFDTAPLSAIKGQTLDLQTYIRLREYIKASPQARDIWFSSESAIATLVKAMTTAQLGAYSQFSKTSGILLSEFFNNGAEVPDMIFRGLVYSGLGGITVNSNRNSFMCEGALVSHGNINVLDAPSFISVYNRDYLDDIGSNVKTNQYRLELVYFATP